MAFEVKKQQLTCPACGAVHTVTMHRTPVREQQIVRCLKCKAEMVNCSTIWDYDPPMLF